ncbi:MAG TPA: hypothetical protein VIO62_11965 [Candidatus Dormibacteraeota bacterium]
MDTTAAMTAIAAETSNQASNEARPVVAEALPRTAMASATPTINAGNVRASGAVVPAQVEQPVPAT